MGDKLEIFICTKYTMGRRVVEFNVERWKNDPRQINCSGITMGVSIRTKTERIFAQKPTLVNVIYL